MNALDSALYTQLTGATALTALLSGTASAYDTQAPQGAAFPYLVFNQQAAASETVDANDRGSWYYQIQAVGTAGFQQVGNIAAQVDAVMQATLSGTGGTALSVAGYSNLFQRRTEHIKYLETDAAGRQIYHAGAVYRFWLTK